MEFCPSGFTAQSASMAQSSRFATAVKGNEDSVNDIENTLNTIHDIITSENNCIGKQHNKIPNLILEVITPDKNKFIYMYI